MNEVTINTETALFAVVTTVKSEDESKTFEAIVSWDELFKYAGDGLFLNILKDSLGIDTHRLCQFLEIGMIAENHKLPILGVTDEGSN